MYTGTQTRGFFLHYAAVVIHPRFLTSPGKTCLNTWQRCGQSRGFLFSFGFLQVFIQNNYTISILYQMVAPRLKHFKTLFLVGSISAT